MGVPGGIVYPEQNAVGVLQVPGVVSLVNGSTDRDGIVTRGGLVPGDVNGPPVEGVEPLGGCHLHMVRWWGHSAPPILHHRPAARQVAGRLRFVSYLPLTFCKYRRRRRRRKWETATRQAGVR